VGKVVQPLQSVNCPDLSISWGMVGLDLSGLSLAGLICGMQHVQSLCAWFLIWLQVGCLRTLVNFGYRCDSYELVALDFRG
jgi:hypothetical protein